MDQTMKNGLPLVSVIAPIYGVEKYVRKCVESLMAQQYSNLEIILVNDGSKDQSGKIIDEMAAIDPRIIVIHQKNEGVSVARNNGLGCARGEFVMFVDGDDYVEPDYVSYFVNAAIAYGADMMVNTSNFTHTHDKQIGKESVSVWKDTRVIEGIYLGLIFVAVWNKLYRRSVIEKHRIRFHKDIWYGEGMLFNIEYLQHVNSALVGSRNVYHQIYNPDSAMRKFSLESNLCGIRSMEVQKSVWEKVTPGIERAWRYHYRNFSQSIICGLVSVDDVKRNRELYNKCVKNMHRDMLLPWRVNIPVGDKLRLTFFAVAPHLIAKRRKRKAQETARIQEEKLLEEKR